MLRLVLASQSPRRHRLLTEAGFEFTVDPVKVSEIIDENLNAQDAVLAIAQDKAKAAAALDKYSKTDGFLILTADTMVAIDDQILGKPENIEQAKEFLRRLSGRTHEVITALCLTCSHQGPMDHHVEVTRVTFHTLGQEQVDSYVASGEPMDKAGAYGLQGEGRHFVERIDGSWSNVVGLPMEALERLLKRNGWQVGRR